ncbi:hypothetical protein HaLaN_13606, partial [Haematococcus lacustris]
MSRLVSENTELQQQLEAALAAKAANGAQFLLLSLTKALALNLPSLLCHLPAQLGEAQQRVEVLASACAAAQKERTALQQILDTKAAGEEAEGAVAAEPQLSALQRAVSNAHRQLEGMLKA